MRGCNINKKVRRNKNIDKGKDWNEAYKQDDTPWDTGITSKELEKALHEEVIAPCRALELGCGTGTNAIYLAKKGFDVTAVDISQLAIKKAREKAEAARVKVRFIQAEIPNLRLPGEIFDFVFDRGCFHAIRQEDRQRFVKMLTGLTTEGSIYLMLCGNAREPREDGPPVLTEEEIRETFSRYFDFRWIREFRFVTTDKKPDPLGYSCLMERKRVNNPDNTN